MWDALSCVRRPVSSVCENVGWKYSVPAGLKIRPMVLTENFHCGDIKQEQLLIGVIVIPSSSTHFAHQSCQNSFSFTPLQLP